MGVNDFDENGNMRSAHIFPSGLDKIKQALGIVPPSMFFFVDSPQPGSILDALKTPNKDVDFGALMAALPAPSVLVTNSQYARFVVAPYAGPDMNEVDAALEAIERMEE